MVDILIEFKLTCREMVFLNAEAVSAILKEGTSISTRLGSSLTWHRNIVYKSEENFVYLALIERYLENIITPGSNMSLKFFNEYFIYLFDGVVCSINAAYPSYITVRVTNAEEIINSRLSPRYDVYIAANLKPCWDDKIYSTVVTDLSFGGIAFLCTHKFDYNEELEVTLYISACETINAKGKIIRKSTKSGIFDYSMQFIEIDEHNCSLLSRHFSSLELEISTQYEQYLTNIKGKLSYQIPSATIVK